jgi:hypothetical protein
MSFRFMRTTLRRGLAATSGLVASSAASTRVITFRPATLDSAR